MSTAVATLDSTLASIQVSLGTLAQLTSPDACEVFLRRFTQRALMQAQTVDASLAHLLLEEVLEDTTNPIQVMLAVLPDPDLVALDRRLVLGVELQHCVTSLDRVKVGAYVCRFLVRYMAFSLRLDEATATERIAKDLQGSSAFWLALFVLPEPDLLTLYQRLAAQKEAA